MSNEPEDRDHGAGFEEDLSAYLDGELTPERRAEVARELERSPALAARLEALQRVDDGLAEIGVPPVPADLRARLQARIDAAAGEAARSPSGSRAAANRAPGRRRRWRSAPTVVAAAMAAAVALFLIVRRPVELPPERVVEQPAPQTQPSDSPEIQIAAPEAIGSEPAIASNREPERVRPSPELPQREPAGPEVTPPSRIAEQSPEVVAPAAQVLASAGDEELEVAMEWEVLEDLELIEEIDLLEAMVELAERGRS